MLQLKVTTIQSTAIARYCINRYIVQFTIHDLQFHRDRFAVLNQRGRYSPKR